MICVKVRHHRRRGRRVLADERPPACPWLGAGVAAGGLAARVRRRVDSYCSITTSPPEPGAASPGQPMCFPDVTVTPHPYLKVPP